MSSVKKRLLIVDDETNIRRILQAAFEKTGVIVMIAADAREGLEILMRESFDAVLTDVNMPGMSGYELLNTIRERYPATPVVIMTAFGTIPQAVHAVREGAFEYVTKPFDLEHLKKVVFSAMDSGSEVPVKPNNRAKKASSGKDRALLAVSPKMKEAVDLAIRVADSRATVLITGESGAGKEVVSRLIHERSPRVEKPFVALSCAALPETLLESELFGYEKGAFTGANTTKLGRFELADGGSLFLDEIGEVPMPIQVKLLRVLQEREFERLGATTPSRVDVRLIAATNRDLRLAVEEGIFRLDLLYRLQVVEIHVPSLRDRQEDIIPLAELFLRRFSEENGRGIETISSDAARLLLNYPWPGNVRELENTMERAAVLASREEKTLGVQLLPNFFQSAA